MISESENKFMRTPFRLGTPEIREGLQSGGIRIMDTSPCVRVTSSLMKNSIFCDLTPSSKL
jgi:hypothetical protein